MSMSKTLYSYHIFMFPFKWENSLIKKESFSERFNLKRVDPKEQSQWFHLPQPVSKSYEVELHNEKNYFYQFVHPVLYDDFDEKKDPVIKHFERKEAYDPDKALTYEIRVIANKTSVYRLNLKSIVLNLYSSGTGVLIFYLENYDFPDLDDVLRINQFGRRIFPPFLGGENGVIEPKKYELPDHIAIEGLNGCHSYFENFEHYTANWDWKPAKFIESLIDDFSEDLKISPVTDDRMHVLCRYMNNDLSEVCKSCKTNKDFKKDWYRFVFVDGGYCTCQDTDMMDELLKKHTYTRWQDEGSLNGISRYSFVYIHSGKAPDYVNTHFRTMYARMVELSLIQRASVLKFSEEVTKLSNLKEKKTKDLTKKISTLHKEYIRFVNQIYFREVTAQEQGIELYHMIQGKMQISEHVRDLDNEIEELHQYAVLLEDKERNNNLLTLSIIGVLFVIPTFITGFYGMNVFEPEKGLTNPCWYSLIIPVLIIIPGIALFYLRTKNKLIRIITILIILLFILFIIFIPIMHF